MSDNGEYTVKALAFGGSFVCERVNEPKVFVPFVIPGERITVGPLKKSNKVLSGDLLAISSPSPHRVTPPCPYYQTCGGCDLQHMAVTAQREAKRAMIQSMLERHAGVVITVEEPPDPIQASHYRRRITLHVGSSGEIGFYRRGSRNVVDIQSCFIAEESANKLLQGARKKSQALAPYVGSVECDGDGEALLMKLRDGVRKETVSPLLRDLSREALLILRERGRDFRFKNGRFTQVFASTTGHFSQVNRSGNEALIRTVLRLCTRHEVTELYAGAGNISFPLAECGKRVTAVESNPFLTGRGAEIAHSRKVPVTFETTTAERYVRSRTLTESLVIDPPRSGAFEVLRKANLGPVHQLVYVSCNLPSFTRDVKLLRERGLSLKRLLFIDMFPQTHHVETVSLFEK